MLSFIMFFFDIVFCMLEHQIKRYRSNVTKLNYILILILLLFVFNAEAEISFRKFKGLFCYDGDTCYVTIENENTKIRLLELDTPEISKPKCTQEKKLGIQARDFINELILNAKNIKIKTEYKKDYFGRTLAFVIIDGVNISELLIKNNLGVVYKKGHKKNWCM